MSRHIVAKDIDSSGPIAFFWSFVMNFFLTPYYLWFVFVCFVIGLITLSRSSGEILSSLLELLGYVGITEFSFELRSYGFLGVWGVFSLIGTYMSRVFQKLDLVWFSQHRSLYIFHGLVPLVLGVLNLFGGPDWVHILRSMFWVSIGFFVYFVIVNTCVRFFRERFVSHMHRIVSERR